MKKEEMLSRVRGKRKESYPMPDFKRINPIVYTDVYAEFLKACANIASAAVIERQPGEDINNLILQAYPEAKVIASNIPGVKAALNPDKVDAHALNGTDVGVVLGELGVAENGCVWVEQTMKERAVCFISENLVILLKKENVVSNMHEAYERITVPDMGYGVFISGPSKTADIEQALVRGAQAARSVTIIII